PASSSPTERDLEEETPGGSRAAGNDPYIALRIPEYRLYATGSVISVVGQQMLGVAVGWEMYLRTHSATGLGLVGPIQARPARFLGVPAGHGADRFDRKRLVLVTQVLVAFCSLGLAAVSFYHDEMPRWAIATRANALLGGLAGSLGETGAVFDDPEVP